MSDATDDVEIPRSWSLPLGGLCVARQAWFYTVAGRHGNIHQGVDSEVLVCLAYHACREGRMRYEMLSPILGTVVAEFFVTAHDASPFVALEDAS